MNNCTRCKKELKDLKITVSQVVETERLQDSGVWENLPNLNISSKEILCKECFDRYAEKMSEHMKNDK